MEIIAIIASAIIAVVAAYLGARFATGQAEKARDQQDTETKNKVISALLAQTQVAAHVQGLNVVAVDNRAHVIPIKFPTTPFDVAIFSTNSIAVSDDTRTSIAAYYAKALEINALIDAILTLPTGKTWFNEQETFQHLKDQSAHEMPPLIEAMQKSLKAEIQTLKK